MTLTYELDLNKDEPPRQRHSAVRTLSSGHTETHIQPTSAQYGHIWPVKVSNKFPMCKNARSSKKWNVREMFATWLACWRHPRFQPLRVDKQTRWTYCGECPQYSVRLEALRFFKLNYLHISTSLPSVMADMSRDSIVDRHCLRQRYVPSTRVRRRRRFGGFLYGVCRSGELLWVDSNGKNGN